MALSRLIFVRHGETDWNAAGRLQGHQDIPLNARGRAQAETAGKKLRNLLGGSIEDPSIPWLCSPLGRTRETMALARAAMKLDPMAYSLDPGLIEITFGQWEGKTWPEVQALDPAAAASREAGKWDFTPPGGESYAALAQRMHTWAQAQSGVVVAVAHGGVARALLHNLAGVAPERAANIEIWQGRVLVFEDGRYRWV